MDLAPGRGKGRAAGLLRLLPLALLVLGYLRLGLTAVASTAPWQVPDEPAHFNHVRQLWEGREAVIAPGDYPFDLVARIQDGALLSSEQVAAIQYEDHQPPLYYALGAAVLRLYGEDPTDPAIPLPSAAGSTAALLRLRHLSLLLGACTLVLFWWVTGLLRPNDLGLRIAVGAFAAFLPMQLHLNSGVNNDPLAFAITAAALGLALRRLGPDGRSPATWGGAVLAGLAMGVAALSKLSALLPTVLLLLGAELLARRGQRRGEGDDRQRPSEPPLLAWLALAVGLGVLAAAPWLVRNVTHYGWADPLALAAHDRATACPPGAPDACQPRTADWIAGRGLGDLLARGAAFTFQSFWGVFGWMGVFLGRLKGIPIYGALAVATLLALAGLTRRLRRGWLRRGAWLRRSQTTLLLLHLAATFGGFVWYNLAFVQHQGRYLLPGLLPLALAYCAGLRALVEDLAAGLGRPPAVAARLGNAALLAQAAALALLAWVSVTRYIVPALGWPSGMG